MAHYRKVETKIWNDARFLSLSAHGKLAYLFILTHPHMTALGAMRTTIPGLTFELPDAPAKAFREVFAKGLAQADEKACMVWLPKFLYYNTPESPNVVRSWTNAFDLLPDCELKVKLLYTMKDFTEGLTEGFGQAFREGFGEALAKSSPKTSPIQEPEQEQDITPLPLCAEPERSGKTSAFDAFWAIYPRKVGKGRAFKAWKTATQRADRRVIMEGLQKQLKVGVIPKYDRGHDFTPHPATWLNDDRWNDEHATSPQQSGLADFRELGDET